MKTYMAKNGEVAQKWHLVDMDGQVLGRAATEIAMILMGKHRPEYTPHVDTGDYVVVVNAAKVKIVGGEGKFRKREYQTYSQYPGGQKVITLAEMLQENPAKVVREAVRRMLPKNKLGVKMLSKLKVYAGADHEHQAQQPEPLTL